MVAGAHGTAQPAVLEILNVPSDLMGPVSSLPRELASDPRGEGLGVSAHGVRTPGMCYTVRGCLRSTAWRRCSIDAVESSMCR